LFASRRPFSTLLLTTLLGAAIGCSNPSPHTEQSLPAPTGIPSIADEPSLTFRIPASIGGASSEIGRTAFLGGGRIAVDDYDGKRVLVFDSTGHLTRIIGRGGSGPGEFQTPTLVQTFAADSLLVWDAALRRLSFLSATTGTGTAVQLPSTLANGADRSSGCSGTAASSSGMNGSPLTHHPVRCS
jgi:hypothetical protein